MSSPRSSHTTTAVVVAAGAGRRLGALGQRTSKPMVSLLERPLIDWVLDRLAAAGIGRCVVVAHPDDVRLQAHLARRPGIQLATQPQRRGMADAIACALPLVDDDILACACDSLFPPNDIAGVVTAGRALPAGAALGVLDMGVAATASRSAVVLDGDRVVDIREKPAPGTVDSPLVGLPLYWLPRSIHPLLQRPPDPGRERQVSHALAEFIAAGGNVHACRVAERLEITHAEDVAAVEARLRGG